MAQPLMGSARRRAARSLVGVVVAAALAACGGKRHAPPSPAAPPPPPMLAGATVMLLPLQDAGYARLPVQGGGGAGEQLDAELAYWLAERGAAVRWVLPERLREVLARSPGLGIDITNLDVAAFRYAQVQRVGDPLFGDLVRLGALVNARFALIPAFAGYRPGADGEPGRLELAAIVIDCTDGRVHWFGVVAGEPGPAGTQATAATAAQALARALFP